MLESKYSTFLTVVLIIIVVAIIGLVGYLGFTYYSNYALNKDTEQYVSTFIEEVEGNGGGSGSSDTTSAESSTNTTPGNSSESISGIFSDGNGSTNSNTSTSTSSGGNKKYKNFNVLGTIEIPSINLKYLVLDYPPTTKKLETSVAALYPVNTKLNIVGNVVIIGHNYRNGTFFSNNKKISNGDKIYITDVGGKKVTYKVYKIFTAEVNDTSFYNRDTDGAMEITLSTCTDDTSARLIIQAKAEK